MATARAQHTSPIQPGGGMHFGLTGLAVMGQNLVRNIASRGFPIAVHNRTTEKTDTFVQEHGGEGDIAAGRSVEEFVGALERPRAVMIMVKAGSPVDDVIAELLPHLEPGDLVIDGGNSDWTDTARRLDELAHHDILYLGTGVSGGEEGALHGPSLMPGGTRAAYDLVEPVFTRIAAQVDGTPCCTYIGDGGAGHYVKMVHNGIEYADMQLIGESYDLLHNGLGLDNDALHAVFSEWNAGELDSFLIQITAEVFARKDDDGDGYLIDKVLDTAGQKGTGRHTAQSALELGAPLTAITEAVFARSLSALKDDRVAAAKVLPGPGDTGASQLTKDDVRDALFASKIVAYAQGFDQLQRGVGRVRLEPRPRHARDDLARWLHHPRPLPRPHQGGVRDRAAEEPHARAVLHRAAHDRATRLAAHGRGSDPYRHPDTRVLVVTRVVRRLPPRAPAREPHPGATRPVRRAHVRTRRPRGHVPLRLVVARLTLRSGFRDVGLRERVEQPSQRFGVAFRAQVAGLHRFLDAPRAEREIADRLHASLRGDVGAPRHDRARSRSVRCGRRC